MKKLLPVLLIFLAACGDNSGTNNTTTTTTMQVEAPADPKHWYKHYTGTVAGQPVVADITSVNGAISGYYYYQSQGKLINIYFNPDSTKPNVYSVDEAPEERYTETQSQWEVTVNEHDISGMWKDAAGNKVYDIFLKEDNSQAVVLNVFNFNDSIPFQPGKSEPMASYNASLLLPAKTMSPENSALLIGTINKALGCDTTQKQDVEECLRNVLGSYADEYRKAIDSSDLTAAHNNHYQGDAMSVRYNDNGWLVLEHMASGYTGGAHGNYASSFINADLKGNKIWKLEEIMTVDSNKTSALLDEAARKHYGMSPKDSLEGQYFVSTIRLNGNFYLTHKGITFCYNPYEIASYAQGQIFLFIPYNKIMDLLTPAFCQRMGLGEK
jgi:Protein of unknown function (DUF3298).